MLNKADPPTKSTSFFRPPLPCTPPWTPSNSSMKCSKLAVEADASDIVVKSNKPAYLPAQRPAQARRHGPDRGRHGAGVRRRDRAAELSARCGSATARWTTPMRRRTSAAFASTPSTSAAPSSIVFRYIKSRPPTFEQLNLDPEPLIRLAKSKDGILLVCGATGSGKSSTMAAMLNWINQNLDRHIITIEDPDRVHVHRRQIGLRTARDRHRRARFPPGDPGGAAPEPRHHPHRRDARQGDVRDGDFRRRDRPPGVLDHARRDRRSRR